MRRGSRHYVYLTWGWTRSGRFQPCVGLLILAGPVLPDQWSTWHGAWWGRYEGPEILLSWQGPQAPRGLTRMRFAFLYDRGPGLVFTCFQFGELVTIYEVGIAYVPPAWARLGRQLLDDGWIDIALDGHEYYWV